MPGKTDGGGGGLFDRLSQVIEKLAELAETGDQIQKKGELKSTDERVRGAYQVDVRVGLGDADGRDERPEVEPVAKPKPSVHPVREPLVDVFEEEEGSLIVAQLPGVPCRDVVLELRGDILTVDGASEDVSYHKELLLSRRYEKEQLQTSCRNGVVEIRLEAPR